jgi:hypothetical protein
MMVPGMLLVVRRAWFSTLVSPGTSLSWASNLRPRTLELRATVLSVQVMVR